MCIKSQKIDLRKEGYPQEWLDVMQPDIVIKDWYSGRLDSSSLYEVVFQLRSKDHRVIREYQPCTYFVEQWTDESWCELKYTFSNYGPGVRFIYFQHGGLDTQLWAGWYGIRLTNSSVVVDPPELDV